VVSWCWGSHWFWSATGFSWLANADPIAALMVACVVVYVSWRLARQTIDALLDAAPAGIRNEIMGAVAAVPGVLEVDRVRIRRAGNRYFADIDVALSRRVTFQRSGQVAEEVTDAVQRLLHHADVTVRSLPRASGEENIFDRIRGVASRNNFNIHDVSVQDLKGKLHVELHLELDENLSLREGHELVTKLEAEIRSEVPELTSILTHIESEPATIETGEVVLRETELEQRLRRVVAEFPEIIDVHEMTVKKVRDLIYLSCHCTMSDETPLAKVHDVSTALEIRFKQEAPELFKVLIHTEPATDNRR
jgi:divalent metal cation (Fe/Co/Zn/Cd) transporter